MEKFLYYNELYLIYKELFTENMQEVFDMYYGENLTMQEIADILNISKSRVGSIIKRVEEKLDKFEKLLKINEKNKKISELLEVEDIEIIKKELELLIKGE